MLGHAGLIVFRLANTPGVFGQLSGPLIAFTQCASSARRYDDIAVNDLLDGLSACIVTGRNVAARGERESRAGDDQAKRQAGRDVRKVDHLGLHRLGGVALGLVLFRAHRTYAGGEEIARYAL